MCDNIQTRPSFYVNHFVHATFFLVSIGHVDQFSPSPMALHWSEISKNDKIILKIILACGMMPMWNCCNYREVVSIGRTG